jgi:hypothetical protein
MHFGGKTPQEDVDNSTKNLLKLDEDLYEILSGVTNSLYDCVIKSYDAAVISLKGALLKITPTPNTGVN